MSGNKTSARRGEIGLGDLVVALATLHADSDAHLRTLGRCLGLRGLSLRSQGTLKVAAAPRLRHRRAPPRPPEPRARGMILLPPPAPLAPAEEYLDTSLEPLSAALRNDSPVPDWHAEPSLVAAKAAAPPRDQLFPRRTASGVVGAAIATLTPGRQPDIDRLIGHIVSGRPFREVPRLATPTRSRGVQLLLDRNESMTPFFPDQMDLAQSFMQVAGAPRCEVFEFIEDPAAAFAYSVADRAIAWRPQPGRPVVVITDFGLGDSSGSTPGIPTQRWRRFASAMKRQRCPLLAVVPHEPSEWPVWVEQHFLALHWDPRTRAENVRALVGPGHRVDP